MLAFAQGMDLLLVSVLGTGFVELADLGKGFKVSVIQEVWQAD